MSALASHDLRKHPLLARHPQLWDSVHGQVMIRHYPKDTTLALHGEEAACLWLVLSGWVMLVRQTPDGKETMVGLCTQGDVFGEAALFPDSPYPYTATVIAEGTEIAAIPAPLLRELVRTHPPLATQVMSVLNDRIAHAQLKLEQMSTLSAAQRLGCYLLHLSEPKTQGEHRFQMPVEKHIIAAYLGMKAETFSRSIKCLQEMGVRVQGAVVEIKELAALRGFVCGSCSASWGCEKEEC